MKKRSVLILFLLLAVCVLAGITAAHFLFSPNVPDDSCDDSYDDPYYEELARTKLIAIVETMDEDSEESDYITEDGHRLIFRNARTRTFLLEALAGAHATDATGFDLKPWPTPAYYIGEEDIGGDHAFCTTVEDRFFLFGLKEQDYAWFFTYMEAMSYAGELYGIECTDTPTYLDFIPSDEEIARSNLIARVSEIPDGSDETDYITEDGSCLIFRNGNTRTFLLEALASAQIKEIQSKDPEWDALFSWSALGPEYCAGKDSVGLGRNFIFFQTINERTLVVVWDDETDTYFCTYIAALLQAGELYGIEKTDTPTYLEFALQTSEIPET